MGTEVLLIAAIVFMPLVMPGSKKSVVELFPSRHELLCTLGSRERCVAIAAGILSEKKNWPLIEKALADTEKFCDKNDSEACYVLGTFQLDEIGGGKTDPGIQRLQKACELNHALACSRLKAKKDRARELWNIACDLSDGQACFHLAWAYETVDKNIQQASLIYEKGCAAAHAASCNAVGFYLEKSGDTAREAARHYLVACRGGNFTGCTNAGLLYKTGKGVPKSHSHAQSLLFLSCEQGKSGFGCYEYARFLREYGSFDSITELSKWEAAQKFKQSCRLGYDAACSEK